MAKFFFWLHVKKSGGTSIRTILQPHYTLVDRAKKPVNFIQSKPSEYNDILNNYRVVLGEYQFKRTLFAKKFLFVNLVLFFENLNLILVLNLTFANVSINKLIRFVIVIEEPEQIL